MQCKKCSQENYVKAGFVRGKQRYKCKRCHCFFTDTAKPGYSSEVKLAALKLYLEGMGFRAIERFLNVSNVTVMNWVKNIAEEMEEIRKDSQIRGKAIIKVMELDEMWHYVGKKNKNSGFGWLLTGLPAESLPGSSVLVVKRLAENSGKK